MEKGPDGTAVLGPLPEDIHHVAVFIISDDFTYIGFLQDFIFIETDRTAQVDPAAHVFLDFHQIHGRYIPEGIYAISASLDDIDPGHIVFDSDDSQREGRSHISGMIISQSQPLLQAVGGFMLPDHDAGIGGDAVILKGEHFTVDIEFTGRPQIIIVHIRQHDILQIPVGLINIRE